MKAPFPVDRDRPPRRVVYRASDRTIVLRPWTVDDADALIAAVEASRTELKSFMPWAHAPLARATEFDLLRKFNADYWAGREYTLGMFSEAGDILGGAGLHPRMPLNPRSLEVGYWCHSAHAGQGLVTLAVRALAVLAFDKFGCDRLQVMHDEANAASRRVVEKCDFRYEGTLRNALAAVDHELYANGYAATSDCRMYALCPEDLVSVPWLAEARARTTIEPVL